MPHGPGGTGGGIGIGTEGGTAAALTVLVTFPGGTSYVISSARSDIHNCP